MVISVDEFLTSKIVNHELLLQCETTNNYEAKKIILNFLIDNKKLDRNKLIKMYLEMKPEDTHIYYNYRELYKQFN